MQPPENEMPASVAFDAMLLQGEDVAVFLSGLRVHSSGLAFTIDVRARRGLRSDDEEYVDPFFGRGARQVLLGVELPDGRRSSNLGPRRFEDAGGALALHHGGGGSGGRSAEADYFLTPLPPAGEVRLVCAWPARGLTETVTVLPTAEIRQAATRVVELWPWEPEEHDEPGVWKPRLPSSLRAAGSPRRWPPCAAPSASTERRGPWSPRHRAVGRSPCSTSIARR